EGAVERIALGADGAVTARTIGDAAAVGICGSGLVDLLSELLRTGRMNELGRFTDDASAFVVDDAHGLALSEADVNELAQAKGANVAGLAILLDTYGLSLERLDRLYLAGGFSRHLDVGAASRIALLPDLPPPPIPPVATPPL